VVGSELVQKYIGEGARLVRELFEHAKLNAPSIIFIDEIDAIGAQRTESITSGDREVQRTLMQLLADLDGFDNRGDVKIIGATNRIDILDPALLRPGRMNLHKDVDLSEVSALTEGKNGSDLRAICTEAGMFAIRMEKDSVDMNDFIKAIDKVRHDLKHGLPDLSDGAMFA